jgi:spermidine synthase
VTNELWITEQLHPFYRTSLKYTEMLLDVQTKFQHLQVVQTEFFGRVMLLDGIIQLTELDNMGYHELITNIGMLAVDQPKRVLVVGGGDGGVLQQMLYHPGVEEAVICELDQGVIDAGREFFPKFNDPYADSRVEIVIRDAFYYLKENVGKFDVIVADTTDPIGAAEKLFTEEFYGLMVNALTPGGVAVSQCEQMFFNRDLIRQMMINAKKLVAHPAYYYSVIPTYPGGQIGYMYMSNEPWQRGLGKSYPKELRYLNAEVHQAAFALPQFLKETLAN